MQSKAVASFWTGYNRLPKAIQARARKQYQLWLDDPQHQSLRFKKVGDYWSARVTGAYRAVGIKDGDTIVWFLSAPMQSMIVSSPNHEAVEANAFPPPSEFTGSSRRDST